MMHKYTTVWFYSILVLTQGECRLISKNWSEHFGDVLYAEFYYYEC